MSILALGGHVHIKESNLAKAIACGQFNLGDLVKTPSGQFVVCMCSKKGCRAIYLAGIELKEEVTEDGTIPGLYCGDHTGRFVISNGR